MQKQICIDNSQHQKSNDINSKNIKSQAQIAAYLQFDSIHYAFTLNVSLCTRKKLLLNFGHISFKSIICKSCFVF